MAEARLGVNGRGKRARDAIIIGMVMSLVSVAGVQVAHARRGPTISKANVKEFSARFESVLDRIYGPLVNKLRRLRPDGRQQIVSFTLDVAGGRWRWRGSGWCCPSHPSSS